MGIMQKDRGTHFCPVTVDALAAVTTSSAASL
jgi:hypothetical protein